MFEILLQLGYQSQEEELAVNIYCIFELVSWLLVWAWVCHCECNCVFGGDLVAQFLAVGSHGI